MITRTIKYKTCENGVERKDIEECEQEIKAALDIFREVGKDVAAEVLHDANSVYVRAKSNRSENLFDFMCGFEDRPSNITQYHCIPHIIAVDDVLYDGTITNMHKVLDKQGFVGRDKEFSESTIGFIKTTFDGTAIDVMLSAYIIEREKDPRCLYVFGNKQGVFETMDALNVSPYNRFDRLDYRIRKTFEMMKQDNR